MQWARNSFQNQTSEYVENGGSQSLTKLMPHISKLYVENNFLGLCTADDLKTIPH